MSKPDQEPTTFFLYFPIWVVVAIIALCLPLFQELNIPISNVHLAFGVMFLSVRALKYVVSVRNVWDVFVYTPLIYVEAWAFTSGHPLLGIMFYAFMYRLFFSHIWASFTKGKLGKHGQDLGAENVLSLSREITYWPIIFHDFWESFLYKGLKERLAKGEQVPDTLMSYALWRYFYSYIQQQRGEEVPPFIWVDASEDLEEVSQRQVLVALCNLKRDTVSLEKVDRFVQIHSLNPS